MINNSFKKAPNDFTMSLVLSYRFVLDTVLQVIRCQNASSGRALEMMRL